MKDKLSNDYSQGNNSRQPYRMRMPGFLINREIGLGDVVKQVTYAIGIKPCGGCEQRVATLNNWIIFSR